VGTLVTSRHPYDLAEAIGALLADGPRRATLAAAAPIRLAELSLQGASDRFAGLLCTLLDRPGRNR
jgi:hypothetical protein